MKKIFCPTDFSDTAHNAIAYAAKLTHAVNGELTLFNVQSLFELTPHEVLVGRSLTNEVIKEQLENQSREVSKAFKISCYSEVQPTSRSLSSVIAKKAGGYDLIVMGTNGPDDMYQFISGSNTYNVIRKTAMPLLMVPSDYGYTKIDLVVYAYDYLGEQELPLRQLTEWVKVLDSRLSVLQVLEDGHKDENELHEVALQRRIRKIYENEIPLNFDSILASDVAEGIYDYLLKNDVEVLALCSKRHSLFERLFKKSIIREITARPLCPVFIFHE